MSKKQKLNGLYVITDDNLTPDKSIYEQVEKSLKGGASIIQLRDKVNTDEVIKKKALKLQELCKEYGALFVLNDKIEIAIDIQCDGLHIGKSDHDNFKTIRKYFDGVIGVSCYGDIDTAKRFESLGADYVAFGSFFYSPTKPNSNIVPMKVLSQAREELEIPVCAIGGINTDNVTHIMEHEPHMVSLINDIWSSKDITSQSSFYTNQFKSLKISRCEQIDLI